MPLPCARSISGGFEDGRFVEHWDELNTLDIFSQVGAVPPLGQPS
jgi:hypothetical protein